MKNELLSKALFNIIVCPICKSDLQYTKDKKGLKCDKCGKAYPIKEGIPILLPSEK